MLAVAVAAAKCCHQLHEVMAACTKCWQWQQHVPSVGISDSMQWPNQPNAVMVIAVAGGTYQVLTVTLARYYGKISH